MIETVNQLSRLREIVGGWKRAGLRVALVPTMGNLHAGHFSLIELARANADRVVASVFVNPTQFGPNEDFAQYPRTPDADRLGLEAAGCDVLWMPAVEQMYPLGTDHATRMRAPGISDVLEGACRPGHFDGVCTVVARLFNQVQPDVAAFGRKDYQQLAVIRQMVADLAFPIEILGAPIVREDDGLARSSRNQYLSAPERALAVELRRTLLQVRDECVAGKPRAAVQAAALARLQAAGFEVDYCEVRLPDLAEPTRDDDGPRVALLAARLGRTRLIDNIEFQVPAR
ncbi:pantoate--beta-alanine ligase [Stenotrophomonas sp. MMGLT7]|uniref:pantoate--beta-alanine ligase n=1 Tax=Stenotrophomonas sp. MMGLT7 TaxID=2901227 RepID=UPI001E55C719|nr:pantoate--beta-alanine ligase [Stenotrophomonas sp. MMGLT7]MCD7097012.1 pantoate--beta-alanine ligase [Stenotrophomonas sp. MMGLT7]